MTEDKECCSQLSALFKDEKVPFSYSRRIRSWTLTLQAPGEETVSGWKRGTSPLQGIAFCPFCAAELPSDLGTEWFDTLEAIGFDDPRQQDTPEEFRSDRWWKERGL